MGALRLNRVFRWVTGILMILLIIGLCICVKTKYDKVLIISSVEELVLLKDADQVNKYKILSDTSIQCDVTTLSTLVNKMLADGYLVERVDTAKQSIEIIISNNLYVHHLYYKATGELTNISSPLEKSYIPFSYIYEER